MDAPPGFRGSAEATASSRSAPGCSCADSAWVTDRLEACNFWYSRAATVRESAWAFGPPKVMKIPQRPLPGGRGSVRGRDALPSSDRQGAVFQRSDIGSTYFPIGSRCLILRHFAGSGSRDLGLKADPDNFLACL